MRSREGPRIAPCCLQNPSTAQDLQRPSPLGSAIRIRNRLSVLSSLCDETVIAVGTVIADRPPHRSVRAELPHTALTSDVDLQAARPDKDAESSASVAISG